MEGIMRNLVVRKLVFSLTAFLCILLLGSAYFSPAQAAPNPAVDGNPYAGTPWAVPGKIEVENYNSGGEGIAYHDIDATNNGTQYRTDGVDIEATTDTGAGYDVGWTATGEWLKYTVNITTTGTYSLAFRVASPNIGSTFHME